jgi:TetR/AcrR family transcriptional regulator, transcriptional repressor for nem operon
LTGQPEAQVSEQASRRELVANPRCAPEAAGVPKGSFYNHFESKEVLGAELVLKYAEKRAEIFSILGDSTVAPVPRFRKYFEELAASAELSSGCLFANFALELSQQSPLIRERVAAAFAGWSATVAAVIREAQDAGEISKESSPEALAAFLVHAYEGALLRAKVDNSRAPLDHFLSTVFTKVLT